MSERGAKVHGENDRSDVPDLPGNVTADRDAYVAGNNNNIFNITNNYFRGPWLHSGNWPVIAAVATLAAAAIIATGISVLSAPRSPAPHPGSTHRITPSVVRSPQTAPPSQVPQTPEGTESPEPGSSGSPAGGLSAVDRKFVIDMRGTFTFQSSVQDSVIASFGEQVCGLREAGTSVASAAPAVQHHWSNATPGGAIHMIVLATKDICPREQTAQTVTYVVTGSHADVMYGQTGSNAQGTVPMSVTQPLASPQYYAITAQLQGSGSVDCQIKVDGVIISSASASGSYNIARCQINYDTTRSWVDTNNAG